jgi:hypothetical protein
MQGSRFAIVWQTAVILAALIPLWGCESSNVVSVEVKNESNQELHDIVVKLQTTTRQIQSLKPEETVTVTFPLAGDVGFWVEAKGLRGGEIKQSVGYCDTSTRKGAMIFRTGPQPDSIAVKFEEDMYGQ